MLYEVYQSGEDINTHRETLHYKRWVECGIPLILGERVRTLYNKINT
jgi:quinol monooxygenase YgiN